MSTNSHLSKKAFLRIAVLDLLYKLFSANYPSEHTWQTSNLRLTGLTTAMT